MCIRDSKYCPRTVALHRGEVVYDGPSAALTPQMLGELYGANVAELFGQSAEMPDLMPGMPAAARQVLLAAAA